jgi:hypothetical protein
MANWKKIGKAYATGGLSVAYDKAKQRKKVGEGAPEGQAPSLAAGEAEATPPATDVHAEPVETEAGIEQAVNPTDEQCDDGTLGVEEAGQAEQEEPVSTPRLDESSVKPVAYEKLNKKVKNALSENVSAEETIKVVIRGAHGQAIVGTDSRAFICKPGFMAGAAFGMELTSWSYRNVTGVQAHKGMLSGAVVLQAPGQTGNKTSYWSSKDDNPTKAPNAIPVAGDWTEVNAGVARLRELIDAAHRPAAAPVPTSSGGAADELRKLADLRDQGILTDEEFQAAKARVLES